MVFHWTLNEMQLYWPSPQSHGLAPSSFSHLTLCHFCFAHLATTSLALCQVLLYLRPCAHAVLAVSTSFFCSSYPSSLSSEQPSLSTLFGEVSHIHCFLTWSSSYFLTALITLLITAYMHFFAYFCFLFFLKNKNIIKSCLSYSSRIYSNAQNIIDAP